MKGKWIVVDSDIYQQLKGLSEQGETFSAIIRRLIESHEAQATTNEEAASIADTKPDASNIDEQDERKESWEV